MDILTETSRRVLELPRLSSSHSLPRRLPVSRFGRIRNPPLSSRREAPFRLALELVHPSPHFSVDARFRHRWSLRHRSQSARHFILRYGFEYHEPSVAAEFTFKYTFPGLQRREVQQKSPFRGSVPASKLLLTASAVNQVCEMTSENDPSRALGCSRFSSQVAYNANIEFVVSCPNERLSANLPTEASVNVRRRPGHLHGFGRRTKASQSVLLARPVDVGGTVDGNRPKIESTSLCYNLWMARSANTFRGSVPL